MPKGSERERFERAFVATSYVLGRRGPDLLAPLPDRAAGVALLAQKLAAPERERRAQALAGELGVAVAELLGRGLE